MQSSYWEVGARATFLGRLSPYRGNVRVQRRVFGIDQRALRSETDVWRHNGPRDQNHHNTSSRLRP